MYELVLFGVTGDLARQKLIPSLFSLYIQGLIPKNTSFIGFGRKAFNKHGFQNTIAEILKTQGEKNKSAIEEFASQWTYVESELHADKGYIELKKILKSNSSVFYVSLPPQFQKPVAQMLFRHNILTKKGDRKIAFEKPFGASVKSAKELQSALLARIRNEQIYRVDHYMGKHTLSNLLQVQETGLLQRVIQHSNVKKIIIRFCESKTVDTRGAFYDSVGALKDVFQNHMLYMASVILRLGIKQPNGDLKVKVAEKNKALDAGKDILKSIAIKKDVTFSQYVGYTSIQGVNPSSQTETAFHIDAEVSEKVPTRLSSIRGVSLEFIGGKGFKESDVSIEIQFKKSSDGNVKFGMNSSSKKDRAYEYVFLSIFDGDICVFPTFESVVESWNITEKVLSAWKRKKKSVDRYPLGLYPQDIY